MFLVSCPLSQPDDTNERSVFSYPSRYFVPSLATLEHTSERELEQLPYVHYAYAARGAFEVCRAHGWQIRRLVPEHRLEVMALSSVRGHLETHLCTNERDCEWRYLKLWKERGYDSRTFVLEAHILNRNLHNWRNFYHGWKCFTPYGDTVESMLRRDADGTEEEDPHVENKIHAIDGR